MMLITTLVVSFLVCCMLEFRCGLAGEVSGLQAKARLRRALACTNIKSIKSVLRLHPLHLTYYHITNILCHFQL